MPDRLGIVCYPAHEPVLLASFSAVPNATDIAAADLTGDGRAEVVPLSATTVRTRSATGPTTRYQLRLLPLSRAGKRTAVTRSVRIR